jgi:ketosteroid isomerase-like protein
MSEENVEVVRRLYEAVERGDSSAVYALYDPDVEADFSESPGGDLLTAEPLIYRGHDGIRRLGRDWGDAWAEDKYELGELIDAGSCVIAAVTYRGRGRGSGIEVTGTGYPVWWIRQGKVVKVVWFRTRQEAIEAAGPSE